VSAAVGAVFVLQDLDLDVERRGDLREAHTHVLSDVSVPKKSPDETPGPVKTLLLALMRNTKAVDYLAAFYPALSFTYVTRDPVKQRRPADVAAFRHLAGRYPLAAPDRVQEPADMSARLHD
jgi:hypothetical protein